MATIALTAAASTLATGIASPFARAAAVTAARVIGGALDGALFGKSTSRQGPRLSELAVQSSTYGKMIPIAYGTLRIAGNIIWSRPIAETAHTSSSTVGGGKGGGGRVSQSTTTYSYSISLAVGICEGPIDEILRVWADAKLLDLSQGTYRIYKGDEAQIPDALIEGFEGVGSTLAYRGLAYVVIEDFPLEAFGNRIPNFTFEVKKKVLAEASGGQSVEGMVTAITLIPGSGEFVYDTEVQHKVMGQQVGSEWAQQGEQLVINRHSHTGNANVLLALDQLAETFPNLEWVSVVCNWFGTSLDAGDCEVFPGVEFKEGATTTPEEWSVGSYTRSSAHQITIEGDSPRYGGTPDDESILRLLDELSARGYSIMFYPMMLMDVANKPWRGHVTGSASEVASFFTKANGYNDFIAHYATLVEGRVEAFAIGSELIGLTKVTDAPGSYPAVDELVGLAASVKSIMGAGTKLTYGADWTEYHHADGGWYHLDPLWASPDIDLIGIDAYFPLTDAPQNGYDVQAAIDGWSSGEGYDWYYTDEARTAQASLAAAYAWKNIAWWWTHNHVNPDSSTTAWVPESKKIWFTEYGFPSVDGATNQPNVFYDPNSLDSAFPYHSRGRVDFRAQRLGITATEMQWDGSDMVERKFLWTWDARPFPYWPDLLDVWADGAVWKTGHWVQGKLGISSLAAIVADLCERAGLAPTDYDVSALTDLVAGYVLTDKITARQAIEQLQAGYFFDAVESDDVLKFVPRGGVEVAAVEEDALVSSRDGELLAISRLQEIELPQRIDVLYINRARDYQPGGQLSQRVVANTEENVTLSLPIVFADQEAKTVADVALYNAWMERTRYQFGLPMRYAYLEPADVMSVATDSATHTLRITSTQLVAPGMLRVEGIAEDVSVYDFYTPPGETGTLTKPAKAVGSTRLEILDIPAFPADSPTAAPIRFAVCGVTGNWPGAVLYRSDDGGTSYSLLSSTDAAAVIGNAIDALGDGPVAIFDEASTVTVSLLAGELESVSERAVLNGANLAVLGAEVFQFRTATLVGSHQYELSGLLRGRLGTEHATDGHIAGETFVLLNSSLRREHIPNGIIGLSRDYKPVTVGATLGSTPAQAFAYTGVALKPYAPVHIAGERDGSGNLTLAWIRRTRIGGEWRDNVDVPLHEESEAYEVDILDGTDVVRTLSGLTSAQASYSAALQVADFGSAQSNVSVKVYQLSAIVGRGYAGIATV